jgi:hypothetical protein
MNKHVRLITALMLGMATLAIPTLATAQTVTVDIVGATLLARGAAVRLTIEVTCTAISPNPFVDELCAGFGQRVGKDITGGGDCIFNEEPIECDGTPRVFDVSAVPGDRPFKKGVGLGDAFVEICNEDFSQCEEAVITQEIQIR